MSEPLSFFEYARVCFFEKFPRNIQLAADYLDEVELATFFRRHFESILEGFSVGDALPVEDYSWRIFDELKDAGLFETMEDPVAGTFYWTDLPKVGRYMAAQLQESEIFSRKKMLKEDRLYEIVFGQVTDADFDHESDLLGSDNVIRERLEFKATLSESERAKFREYLPQIRSEIEKAEISQEERADALSALDAVDNLSEAPNPLWAVIGMILSSPMLANITAIAALAVAILKP